MADVIILGNGPAGISAAAYTARAGLSTVVIGRDGGSLEKADKIENYYGFASPISGKQLVLNGIQQAARLGVKIIDDEVVGIRYDGKFTVQSKNNQEFEGKSVILATGAARKAPKIQGIREFEGKGVSYCAVCDAFFYRGKTVAVLGEGDYALHEAKELLPIVGSVTILTNGKEPKADIPPEIHVVKKEISALKGDNILNTVVFKDGTSITLNGFFVALGVASSGDFAKTIGAETSGNNIVVDENMQTTVPGLYAAGDCTGGILQISKAVCDGTKAGLSVIQQLRKK
jgi:thioredoxin reductase (NADPH)